MTQLVLDPVAPSEHAPCVFLYSPEGAGSQEVTHSSGEEGARLYITGGKEIAEIHRGKKEEETFQ